MSFSIIGSHFIECQKFNVYVFFTQYSGKNEIKKKIFTNSLHFSYLFKALVANPEKYWNIEQKINKPTLYSAGSRTSLNDSEIDLYFTMSENS